ncbi:MAG: YihA family ribosome biogenesis GTP-binding protein [Deltaproteobacteria bacterium]|nr:YihA family ribosome biogenesis GTP-binding protein [Deltaproteobacteria bacterium]
MLTTRARFLAAATNVAHLPHHRWPEIAFAGRSNVGKSSLLNRLTGHLKLARVSKTPGRTQQLNFFVVNEALVLVDLPGYGFARVPLAVKDQWRQLVEDYLTRRPALRAVVVIIDIRRGLAHEDQQLLDFLAAHGIAAIVAATKSDKITRSEAARQAAALRHGDGLDLHLVSAHRGDGLDRLWQAIEQAAGAGDPPKHSTERREKPRATQVR